MYDTDEKKKQKLSYTCKELKDNQVLNNAEI